MIRKLNKEEYPQAALLSLEVFCLCGSEDFNAEGLEAFKSFVDSDRLLNELAIYGAFENNTLAGILGTKNEGTHISLFFIRKEYQRKGWGRKLFGFAVQDHPVKEMTVNSSSYAVNFYRSLGFEPTGEKQQKNGIIFTPMKREADMCFRCR